MHMKALDIMTKLAYLELIKSIAPHVEESDAEYWIEEVHAHEPDGVKSHIKRLNGLGGTDLAVLYTEFIGKRHPFSTARSVIEGKLCKTLPLLKPILEGLNKSEVKEKREEYGHIIRGYLAESHAKEQFRSDYNLTEYPRINEIIKEDRASGGWSKHPWAKISPDDVLVDPKGKLWLSDYKAPNDSGVIEEWEDYGVPVYYKTQLALYAAYLRDHLDINVDLDNIYLVPISTTFAISPVKVDITQEFMDDVLRCGDHYWNDYVLTKELPAYSSNKSFNSLTLGDLDSQVQQKVWKLVAAKKFFTKSDKNVKTLQKSLLSDLELAGIDLSDFDKTKLGPLNFSNQQRSAIDGKLVTLKLSDNEVITPDMLEDIGKVSHFLKVGPVTGKKHDFVDQFEEVENIVQASIDDAMEDSVELSGVLNLPSSHVIDYSDSPEP